MKTVQTEGAVVDVGVDVARDHGCLVAIQMGSMIEATVLHHAVAASKLIILTVKS